MKVASIAEGPDATKWDAFVLECDGSTAYHQYGWRRIIARSFGHKCPYFAAVDDLGTWRGVLPLVHLRSWAFGNSLVSLPFVNYGGPIFADDEAADLLVNAAERLRVELGASHVELRMIDDCLVGLPTRRHKVTMILDVANDSDKQWQLFNAKLRNQIRKAEKSQLESRLGHSELLDDFYAVLSRNMRDLGSPVHAKAFFKNVLETFPDSTKIIGVYLNGRMIAAGIVLWFRDKVEVPWASSISEYKSLCPNNLLYWEAIKFTIAGGFKRFDFGRSTPNEGTYNFKKQWGAAPVQLHWQYIAGDGASLPESDTASEKYESAIRIWRRLPVAVTRLLGPMIRKRISL